MIFHGGVCSSGSMLKKKKSVGINANRMKTTQTLIKDQSDLSLYCLLGSVHHKITVLYM